MNAPVPCVLFSRDSDLARRLNAYATAVAGLLHVRDGVGLKRVLQQHSFSVLLHDVRGTDSANLLRDILHEWPLTLVIAVGTPRSDPILEALDLGVYGALPTDADSFAIESLLRQATDRQRLAQALRILSQSVPQHVRHEPAPAPRSTVRDAALLRQLLSPLRHFNDISSVLQGIVDGIASSAVVMRAGLFTCIDDHEFYQFKAGTGCLDETRAMEFRRDAPLVRWLELNAHAVSRDTLGMLRDPAQRLLIERALDIHGAELIVPLQGRTRMLGWLFLGRRASGAAFDDPDLQDIMLLCEHVSTSIENALLYREVALQKSFAETLLKNLPTGVIAANSDGSVHWFNETAEHMLNLNRTDVIGRPVESLGTILAHALRTCLAGHPKESEQDEWEDPHSHRVLSLRTAVLNTTARAPGAVAFIYDRTREQLLNRRQQELERAAFWTELAASMSHEIRNPMVAIKTFAQLLPERYSDREFRAEFSTLVAREVDRLNAIIEQINSFANRPELNMESVNLGELIEEGRGLAALRVPAAEPAVDMRLAPSLPPIRGDRRALAECFAHIFTNAYEALQQRPQPRISVTAALGAPNGRTPTITIAIRDNGPGISPEILENIFSPFSTTKSRAMGLGLPLVQRTLADHHGHVSLESTKDGTCVNLALPVQPQEIPA